MKSIKVYAGFPGIGKSTLTKMSPRYIDLESSAFRKQSDYINWVRQYVDVVEHLLESGNHYIFVSSHELVTYELKRRGIEYAVIYPDIKLKDQWIDKLKDRFIESGDPKDLRAATAVMYNFEFFITSLMKHHKNSIVIHEMSYDLKKLIEETN